MQPRLKVCTSTLYKKQDNVRSVLGLQTARNSLKLGLDITLVDAGSENEMFRDGIKEIEAHPKFHYFQIPADIKTSMGECRRLAFFLSAGGDFQAWVNFKKENSDLEFDYYSYLREQGMEEDVYHLWMEPEKPDLLKEINIESMLASTREGQIPIFVPERDEEAMSTLPGFQLRSELSMNLYTNQMIRAASLEPKAVGSKRIEYTAKDLNFGPKGTNWKGLQYFLNSREKLWGSIITPVADAVVDGLEISWALISYKYPDSQVTQEAESQEFFDKRMIQYDNVLESIRQATHVPKHPLSPEISA